MPTDRIEREIRIDAPIDVVWSIVTEPAHITEWWSERAEFATEPGAAGTLTFHSGTVVNLRVEAYEPPRFFSFRWDYDDEATNGPLVEFTLTADGDATVLRLVETELRRPGRGDDYVASHSRGWDQHLATLKEVAER